MSKMFVVKRDGRQEGIMFDKITSRISKLCYGLSPMIDVPEITQKVISGVYSGITTIELDNLAAEITAFMITHHPDYATLAARIAVSNLHKETKKLFSDVISDLYEYSDPNGIRKMPLIGQKTYEVVMKNKDILNSAIIYDRDYQYQYFGIKTLEKSYLLKLNGKIAEHPQQMIMRVAVGIHGDDIPSVIETYNLMSERWFTHASPTLFNAGTPTPQLSSCFLLSMKDDSIEGIYDTLKMCANISKTAGGIGFNSHCVRSKGSYIAGTNGTSNGLVPMLRVFNNTARYVDQCVVPETVIFTENGPMQIQDVSAKETRVCNLTGQCETVARVLEHSYQGSLLTITNEHGREIQVTPQHPIYVLKDPRIDDINTIFGQLIVGSRELIWEDAENINPGDYVAYAVPEFVQDNDLTADDCYFYALLWDAGIYNTAEYGYFEIKLSDQSEAYQFIISYLERLCIDYNIASETHIRSISWKCNLSLQFRRSDFPDKFGVSKRILNLPNEKLKHFIRGLIDVHSPKDHNGFIHLPGFERFKSPELHYILLRMRIIPTIDTWHVAIPIEGHIAKMYPHLKIWDDEYLIYDNLILSKVSNTSRKEYSGILYDLQMTDQHNYLLLFGLVHNGGGKRRGAFAVWLETHHADIFDVLELKKNTGSDDIRARDLFYGLWVSDLFMRRCEEGGMWSLFSPDTAPGLEDCYGEEFEELYARYEAEGRYVRQVKAQDLWFKILDSQIETGGPYICYKDHVNRKSNQSNVGIIKNSNLCTEIMEYSSPDETAVCNLASIALPMFVNNRTFDFNKLAEVTAVITKNLNKIIDINHYPIPEAKRSNLRHRPIGIGVQGLADAFIKMRYPFESQEAKELNIKIFETIYYSALKTSCQLAARDGPYETYQGSPASQGKLQYDLWNVTPSDLWDFNELKSEISKHGLRNSLLVAPMPTASTAQILGNNESIEPFTNNIYSRTVMAGDFQVVNKYLLTDLIELNLWNDDLKNRIIADDGSIQNIAEIPDDIKKLYKTVWEISQKTIIDMAADRGAFVDQSQSLNIFIKSPNFGNLTSMHFHGWRKGLKTGMYYLRSRAAVDAIKFTVDKEKLNRSQMVCSIENRDECVMCSG